MPARLLLLLLLACPLVGCSQQYSRPCGPGFLGNLLVPQGFAGADFRPACRAHDRCYATPGCCQKHCDEVFLNDMMCACRCSPHPALCRLRAWQWYWQVRLLGAPGYNSAQRQAQCGGEQCGGACQCSSCNCPRGCHSCGATDCSAVAAPMVGPAQVFQMPESQ